MGLCGEGQAAGEASGVGIIDLRNLNARQRIVRLLPFTLPWLLLAWSRRGWRGLLIAAAGAAILTPLILLWLWMREGDVERDEYGNVKVNPVVLVTLVVALSIVFYIIEFWIWPEMQ